MQAENLTPSPKIVYQDDDLVAVSKPAGWLSMADGRTTAPVLAAWLADNLEIELPNGGLAHRLDRETSGLLLAARHPGALEHLRRAFRERLVKKEYRAIVCGVMARDRGIISLPIGRSHRDPRRRVASPKAAGHLRPARTVFAVLERFAAFSYLAVWPETGRTHQIRVHLKAFGCPVAGDQLYGAPLAAPGMARLALHAYRLEFETPSGAPLVLELPPPDDFTQALESLRQKC